MAVYLIAQLKFTDIAAYRRYQAAFPAVFARHPGARVLAADEAPVTLEGDFSPDKVVVMAFADRAAAEAFSNDPDYQRISEDRRAGANTAAVIVQGLA